MLIFPPFGNWFYTPTIIHNESLASGWFGFFFNQESMSRILLDLRLSGKTLSICKQYNQIYLFLAFETLLAFISPNSFLSL